MLGFGKKVTRQQQIVEKAMTILEATRFPLLKAAWEEYARIKEAAEEEGADQYLTTPEWFGLKRLIAYEGHFERFTLYELPLLKSLLDDYLRYDDMMHVLMDHHNDEKEAQHLFTAHPELHKHLPAQFDNTRQVIEVLVEVTHQFRWDIEHFSLEYKADIEEALKRILKQAAK
jgi:hypothetical protein